jgi:hypothetical protein
MLKAAEKVLKQAEPSQAGKLRYGMSPPSREHVAEAMCFCPFSYGSIAFEEERTDFKNVQNSYMYARAGLCVCADFAGDHR